MLILHIYTFNYRVRADLDATRLNLRLGQWSIYFFREALKRVEFSAAAFRTDLLITTATSAETAGVRDTPFLVTHWRFIT